MDSSVLSALSRSPKILERMLRVFPHDRIDDRIEADRFTAREVVAHLADYEQVILDRIRAAVHSPGRSVPAYDADEQAAAHHFNEKEPFHEAEVYESRRGMTIEYVRNLTEVELSHTFVNALGVEYSVRNYLIMVLTHDLLHIEQLTAYLATEVAVHS